MFTVQPLGFDHFGCCSVFHDLKLFLRLFFTSRYFILYGKGRNLNAVIDIFLSKFYNYHEMKPVSEHEMFHNLKQRY